MKIFGYYPATIIAAVQSVLAVVVNLPASPLSAEQAAWFITILSAVALAAEAWAVRPVTVASAVGAVRTTIAAVVLFGVDVSPELSGAIVAAVTFVLGLLLHANGTPAIDPDPRIVQHERKDVVTGH